MLELTGGAYILAGFALALLPPGWLLGAMVASALHELGHLLALRHFRVRVWRISVRADGIRLDTGPMGPAAALVCALGGPVLGSVGMLAWRRFPELGWCALVQSVFNLLPIGSLDGAMAWQALGDLRKSSCKSHRFGVQ